MARSFTAVLVTLSFAACSGPPDVDKPVEGEDLTAQLSQICRSVGEADDCDPCYATEWYDDGLCDVYCALPDPDCPDDLYTFAIETTWVIVDASGGERSCSDLDAESVELSIRDEIASSTSMRDVSCQDDRFVIEIPVANYTVEAMLKTKDGFVLAADGPVWVEGGPFDYSVERTESGHPLRRSKLVFQHPTLQ